MYQLRADIDKNRLYINLEGFLNDEEMKTCTDKTIEEVKKLKPGFDVIADVSRFQPVGQQTIKEVERAQAFFKSAGIRHGMRIVSNATLAGMQFTRIGKTQDYTPETVKTAADAEQILNSIK